jgi:hypothetical protein
MKITANGVDGEERYLSKDENVPLAIGAVACVSVSIPLTYFLGIGYLQVRAKRPQELAEGANRGE